MIPRIWNYGSGTSKNVNERLEEFAKVVGHEFRNPLNVARIQFRLARETYGSDHLTDVAKADVRMETPIEDPRRRHESITESPRRSGSPLHASAESADEQPGQPTRNSWSTQKSSFWLTGPVCNRNLEIPFETPPNAPVRA